ncbi:hypothetical protein [Flavobacterium psychrotrophum]|uniref:hypothetical protein n=1 Tax=Flavobacterium psychrotrophum TaxID=2294119 RepID=UPI000E3105FA|nr:hypothetical protein [Flavobacterium psychrotrophum]
MKNDNPTGTAYNRRYHLQKELKHVLRIDSHKRTIYLPEGLALDPTDQKRVEALQQEYNYIIQTVVFEVPPYQKVMIGCSVGIKGESLAFKKERLFGLPVGTELLRIGQGKNTGGNNVDKFSKPGRYVGSIMLEGKKYYAVLLPVGAVPESEIPHYLLYTLKGRHDLQRDIYTPSGRFSYTRIYLPKFKWAKAEKQITARQKKLEL